MINDGQLKDCGPRTRNGFSKFKSSGFKVVQSEFLLPGIISFVSELNQFDLQDSFVNIQLDFQSEYAGLMSNHSQSIIRLYFHCITKIINIYSNFTSCRSTGRQLVRKHLEKSKFENFFRQQKPKTIVKMLNRTVNLSRTALTNFVRHHSHGGIPGEVGFVPKFGELDYATYSGSIFYFLFRICRSDSTTSTSSPHTSSCSSDRDSALHSSCSAINC